MRHSKEKFTTIGLMTLAMTALAAIGCMRPKTYAPDDSGLGAASFSVGKVELVEGGVKKLDEIDGFSIPSRKLYTLKTCVKAKKSERPAAHALFELSGKSFDGKERDPLYVTTDEKGCFNWTEEIAFNFFGEEVYLTIERRLTATEGSGQRGSAKIRLAVNPWNLSGSASEVIDLQKDSAPKGAEVKSEEDARLHLVERTQSSSKQLAIARFALQSAPSRLAPTEDMVARDFYLTIEPTIRGLDAQKKPAELKLEEASLALDAVLVAVVSDFVEGERKYTVWTANDVPFNVTERGFTAHFTMGLPIVEEDKVRYELFARVKAVPAFDGLRSFEAVLTLGSHWQVLNSYVLPEIIENSNIMNPSFSMSESVEVLEKTLPSNIRPRPRPGNEPGPTPQPEPSPAPTPTPTPTPEPGDQQTSEGQNGSGAEITEPTPAPAPAPQALPETKEEFPKLPPHA